MVGRDSVIMVRTPHHDSSCAAGGLRLTMEASCSVHMLPVEFAGQAATDV